MSAEIPNTKISTPKIEPIIQGQCESTRIFNSEIEVVPCIFREKQHLGIGLTYKNGSSEPMGLYYEFPEDNLVQLIRAYELFKTLLKYRKPINYNTIPDCYVVMDSRNSYRKIDFLKDPYIKEKIESIFSEFPTEEIKELGKLGINIDFNLLQKEFDFTKYKK